MLEDSPFDTRIIQNLLNRSGISIELITVTTGKDYIQKLHEQHFDIILCDYQLPDIDPIMALQEKNKNHPSIPFILITGAVPEDVALALIKEGADDYILKDRLQRLPMAIEVAISRRKSEAARRSTETAQSELTERFQLAAKTSFDVIWEYHLEKNFVYCSEAIEKIIGVPAKENIQPDFLRKFIHPDDLPALQKSFADIINGKENKWRKIFRMIRSNGSIAWINNNALVIRDQNEKAIRLVGVMQDVTEIRRLQHELMEQETLKQKQIAEITIQAQEKERQEIGKELHDNVNQLLATAKIMIDTARSIPEMHDICLAKSQESILGAIHELRNLSHSMMPPAFEKTQFETILKDLAYDINLIGQLNLELILPPSELLQTIDNRIKLAFYRIIQEQVSNILKYAQAKNVSIVIQKTEAFFKLIIQDDGIGFDPTAIPKGIGLKNMESRIHLFEGTMSILTSPGEGCLIKIQIPVNQPLFAFNS
jgi:two-component system sensor histidine kinase UhpB